MRQKPGTKQSHGEMVVKDIRRATRKQYSAEEKIRIVLAGPPAEERATDQGPRTESRGQWSEFPGPRPEILAPWPSVVVRGPWPTFPKWHVF